MATAFENLPRRLFLDSCTTQTLFDYGEYLYDGGELSSTARIRAVADGLANLDALLRIVRVTERAQFEWIVSQNSMQEAEDKRDPGHMRWFREIAHYSNTFLDIEGPSPESENSMNRLDSGKFGYLSFKDRLLLRDAVFLRCDAFLTMERRLPRNAPHIERELGIQVFTPITYWNLLGPWAGLWC